MIRVLIVDDHDIVRAGLRAALSNPDDGTQVVGECADGAQAVTAVDAVHPDVVLMDRQMPGMPGVAATRAVHAAHPSKVLMLSAAQVAQLPPRKRQRPARTATWSKTATLHC